MYGVPDNLQLERLVGRESNFIGLGTWQVQFHVSSLVAIHVEGRWELHDAAGVLVDHAQEPAERDAYRLHRAAPASCKLTVSRHGLIHAPQPTKAGGWLFLYSEFCVVDFCR